jgi:hypothetical protein
VNLFYLDENLEKNAEYHIDSHVNKMQLEAAQMLCSAIWVDKFLGFVPRALTPEERKVINDIVVEEKKLPISDRKISPYLPTHLNHPCTIWTRSGMGNFEWVYNYIDALNSESRYRYRKTTDHKSFEVARNLPLPENLRGVGLTERPICMPEEYIEPGDPIASYRMYYMMDKADFAVWKRRNYPPWWDLGLVEYDNKDPHQSYLNTVKAPTNKNKPHSGDY